MADFALTIGGNSLGALLTAALAARRGHPTCLVLAGHEGFDDSFQARDAFLEGGLLLSDARNPDGPVVAACTELALDWEPVPVPQPTRFHTELGSVRLGPDFAALTSDLAALFPQDRGALDQLAAELTEWYELAEAQAPAPGYADPHPRAWQHETIAALSLTGKFGISARLFPSRKIEQLRRTSFATALERFAPRHRAWWEALLVLQTAHLPLTLDCLTVAQTLGRDRRGLFALAGGLDPFRQQLLHRIEGTPGCAVVTGTIEHLTFAADAPVRVQVEDAGRWTSAQVVCDRAPLLWQAAPGRLPDSVQLHALPGAQRYPHLAGILAALRAPHGVMPAAGQQWVVPRLDLPPTGPNGFWITHLPAGASLPNPHGLHLAAVHAGYLESQLLDPAGYLYPEDDLYRRLWEAASAHDPILQAPLEAFLGVMPQRVAPLKGAQTLLPDPRAAVAAFSPPGRLGTVPQCLWLDRYQHPPADLRQEFVLARRLVAALEQPSLAERAAREVRAILRPGP